MTQRAYRVHVTDGDTSRSTVWYAENEFMAARYTTLHGNEIVYRVEEIS